MNDHRPQDSSHKGPSLEDALETTDTQDAPEPWAKHPATGQQQTVSGPAPIIELDGPAGGTAPVKPLGPRRLARLQREMAEHAREVEAAEQRNRGEVDEDLRVKQQRFAELARRAAAANDQGHRDAQAAVAAGGEQRSQDHAGERIDAVSVVFPTAAAAQETITHEASLADPGRLSSSSMTGRPHEVRIHTGFLPVVPASELDDAARHDVSADAADGTTRSSHVEAMSDGRGTEAPGSVSGDERTGSGAARRDDAPGAPVRAVDAEGLELLEPQDYKHRAGVPVPLVVLLALVLVAAVVLVVMFLI